MVHWIDLIKDDCDIKDVVKATCVLRTIIRVDQSLRCGAKVEILKAICHIKRPFRMRTTQVGFFHDPYRHKSML